MDYPKCSFYANPVKKRGSNSRDLDREPRLVEVLSNQFCRIKGVESAGDTGIILPKDWGIILTGIVLSHDRRQ